MTAIDLKGATVVVTGASRGFGRATAVALAESGAQVVGVARHRGGLEELQRELGDALSCETGDVADPELPARLFGTYRPAAVVLNAGATPVIGPLDGGLPRGRLWPSSRRASRSFVLAALRALRLDPRLRRRQDGSDRGMASSAPGCWAAGCGRSVVARPGSGLPEEPARGVQAGRAGARVVPRLPSRALGTRGCSAGIGLQAGVDGVADLPLQRPHGLFRGLAPSQFPVVIGAALPLAVGGPAGRAHM